MFLAGSFAGIVWHPRSDQVFAQAAREHKFVSAIEADFIENLSERTLEEVKRAFEWLTENRQPLAVACGRNYRQQYGRRYRCKFVGVCRNRQPYLLGQI